jgi:hypothetical protein
MPNDCTNIITITCEHEEFLTEFIENELQPIEKHNTVYNEVIKIYKRGKRGIIFKLCSAWLPNFDWLENILNNYQYFWIKNLWHEDGGMAGVWVGFMKDDEPFINELTWKDLSIEEEDHLFS